uniref:Uncharacterized protein n=1 Tax=Cacopsylla melanoneura TaxID=428564 RepID=A0A8D8QFH1_9HEMI
MSFKMSHPLYDVIQHFSLILYQNKSNIPIELGTIQYQDVRLDLPLDVYNRFFYYYSKTKIKKRIFASRKKIILFLESRGYNSSINVNILIPKSNGVGGSVSKASLVF